MSEHNTNVSEAGERAYAFCRSCSWRTGWMTPDDAWKAAGDHMAGLPV